MRAGGVLHCRVYRQEPPPQSNDQVSRQGTTIGQSCPGRSQPRSLYKQPAQGRQQTFPYHKACTKLINKGEKYIQMSYHLA